MQLKVYENIVLHCFSDESGVLFYNTVTEESLLVAREHCKLIEQNKASGERWIMTSNDDVRHKLTALGFATS